MTYKQADPEAANEKIKKKTPADRVYLQGQRTEMKSIFRFTLILLQRVKLMLS